MRPSVSLLSAGGGGGRFLYAPPPLQSTNVSVKKGKKRESALPDLGAAVVMMFVRGGAEMWAKPTRRCTSVPC